MSAHLSPLKTSNAGCSPASGDSLSRTAAVNGGGIRETESMITTVTVSIIDSENNFGVAMSFVGEGETLDEVIETVKAEALENFSENDGSAACRVIVNVNYVPMPKLPAAVITATLPEGADDVTVEGTITE
jgi:hypothetical protein